MPSYIPPYENYRVKQTSPTVTTYIPLKSKSNTTRVAIYGRVSTEKEKQTNSLENQISYLKIEIAEHPFWVLVDVYTDRRSGRSNKNRPGFKRLMKDCYDGKIDLILVKNIARFGRDTVEILDTLNKLKEIKVYVYFDQESLHSQNGQDMFLISLHEAFAQAENQSRSENIKWGIHKSMQNPNAQIYRRPCFGYRNDEDGWLTIYEPEAVIVREIYDLYLSGFSILAIMRELESRQNKSPSGKDQWSKRTIEIILSNEKYAGNVMVNKSYISTYPRNKRIFNNGEKERYCIENSHAAIIPMEVFEQVQLMREKRTNIMKTDKGNVRKDTHYSMKGTSKDADGNAES